MRVAVRGPDAVVGRVADLAVDVSGVRVVRRDAETGTRPAESTGSAESTAAAGDVPSVGGGTGRPGGVTDADGPIDVVVAVGEASLRRALLDGGAPVLAVDVDLPAAVSLDGLTRALEAHVGGDRYSTTPVALLDVRAGAHTGRAVFDVSLLTTEAAKISGYGVHEGDVTHGRFRADGVVVATPIGSHGYAQAVGGPLLSPGTGLAAVPVSPFATHADSWVVGSAVRVTVERDDSEVSLFVDDRELARLSEGDEVTISVDGEAELLTPPVGDGSGA